MKTVQNLIDELLALPPNVKTMPVIFTDGRTPYPPLVRYPENQRFVNQSLLSMGYEKSDTHPIEVLCL